MIFGRNNNYRNELDEWSDIILDNLLVIFGGCILFSLLFNPDFVIVHAVLDTAFAAFAGVIALWQLYPANKKLNPLTMWISVNILYCSMTVMCADMIYQLIKCHDAVWWPLSIILLIFAATTTFLYKPLKEQIIEIN